MGKEFGLSGLSRVQQFSTHEVLQVFMVVQNLDRKAQFLQVVPTFLESLDDDCHKFFVVDFIIAFHRAVLLREEGHPMQNTVIVVL